MGKYLQRFEYAVWRNYYGCVLLIHIRAIGFDEHEWLFQYKQNNVLRLRAYYVIFHHTAGCRPPSYRHQRLVRRIHSTHVRDNALILFRS